MIDFSDFTVVVAGMGPMGRGIARVFRMAGAEVIVSDISPEATQAGVLAIADESAADGQPVEVRGLPFNEAIEQADLFVEAIVERMDLKASLLRQAAEHGRPDLVVASNTSSLSIGEMGKEFGDPTRVAGLHFFNPPTKMKLVEVVRGAATSEKIIAELTELIEAVGKTPVACADTPNFIVNRVCRPLYYEAELLVSQGVEPAVIDAVASEALGHPMGPLTLLDFTGLHTHLASSESALREFGDPKYRPIPLVRGLVRNGMTGKAAGRGFYNYECERPRDAINRVVHVAPEDRQQIIRFAGPNTPECAPAVDGLVDVVVYSCHAPPSSLDLTTVEELLTSHAVVVDSSDAGWLGSLPEGAEWARVHMTDGESFVEVVNDPIAGVVPGAAIDAVLGALGAKSVAVPALPGLVADRLANCMANEAYTIVEEGTALAADVDTALRLGMNHPVGPFQYVQRVGVGTVHTALRSMMNAFGDSRYRPTPLIRRQSAGGPK